MLIGEKKFISLPIKNLQKRFTDQDWFYYYFKFFKYQARKNCD